MTPSSSRPAVYKIAEKKPDFPCWMWSPSHKNWAMWRVKDSEDFPQFYDCTHWSPDSPTAPKDAPEADPRCEHFKSLAESQPCHICGIPRYLPGATFCSAAHASPATPAPSAGTETPPYDKLPEVFGPIFRAAVWPWTGCAPVSLTQDECKAVTSAITQLTAQLAEAKENWRISSVCRELTKEREELQRELEQSQSVVLATRQMSIDSMNEIRGALGVPSGNDDKSSKRVIDYVRQLVADLSAARQEAQHLREDLNAKESEYALSLDSQADLMKQLSAARQEIEQLDNLTASGIHSCSDQCQRPLCVLRRELATAQSALAECGKDKEIVDLLQSRLVPWGDEGLYEIDLAADSKNLREVCTRILALPGSAHGGDKGEK